MAWLSVGCGSGSGGQGAERQSCFPNGTCNAGLRCLSDVCVDDGAGGSGGHDAAGADVPAPGTGGASAGSGGVLGTGGGIAGVGGGGVGNDGGRDGGGDDAPADAGITSGTGGNTAGPDAAADAPQDAPAAWTPRALGSSLVIWLNDTGIVADKAHNITAWNDSSGQSPPNSANRDPGVQGTAATELPDWLNGHAVALFGASSAGLHVASRSSLDWTGDFAYAIVARSDMYAVGAFFGEGGCELTLASGGAEIRIENDFATPSIDSADLTGLSAGAFHVLVGRRAGNVLELRADGRSATFTETSATPCGTTTAGIGGQGDLAEVIAVKGTLSEPDIVRLETYLRAEFALGPACASGQQTSCTCPGFTTMGTAVCDQDASGFGACVCPACLPDSTVQTSYFCTQRSDCCNNDCFNGYCCAFDHTTATGCSP